VFLHDLEHCGDNNLRKRIYVTAQREIGEGHQAAVAPVSSGGRTARNLISSRRS
jgi:hypothetical protein